MSSNQHKQDESRSSKILFTEDLLSGLSSNSRVKMFSNEPRQDESRSSNILITEDLLSGFSRNSRESADMDLQPAEELERLYYRHHVHENCSSSEALAAAVAVREAEKNKNLQKLKEEDLDLKLDSSWSSKYQSVYTLEKVQNALQREAEKQKKRSSSRPVAVGEGTGPVAAGEGTGKMFASACPACGHYVITLNTSPKCPRCHSIVSSSMLLKKPKLDLNKEPSSSSGSGEKK